MSKVINPSEYAGYKKDKFTFVQMDKSIHDTKFETKPVSYLKGCWQRFSHNKGSIVAGVILLLIILFAIIAPMTTDRTVKWNDANYAYVLPKNPMFEGTGFWDGTQSKKIYQNAYDEYRFYETEDKPIVGDVEAGEEKNVLGQTVKYYNVTYDTYAVGAKELRDVTTEDIEKIREWESDTGRKIMLPLIDYETYVDAYFDDIDDKLDPSSPNYDPTYATKYPGGTTTLRVNMSGRYAQNANLWYELVMPTSGQQFVPKLDSNDQPTDIYKKDASGQVVYVENVDSAGLKLHIRVDYNNYYEYLNGEACFFLFGANSVGNDIFVRLASGARLSLILGVCVSAINLVIGLIWGSISGYYGGTVDLIMERITDILSAIPFVIVATLFQLHLAAKVGAIVSLLFAFVVTGWIGTASTTRMQFYRFKNQEYVLASRTLGAKDLRLIFVDILPNALGTLITSSVLMIPSVIFSESSLSYLNIVNLSTSNITSVGTLLNDGSNFVSSYPHMIVFPAIFISLLMITFNLIGNGLRDAFNPTLRGGE